MNVEYLKSIVDYDPLTGVFTWKPRPWNAQWSSRFAGTTAGHVSKFNGYIKLRYNGKSYSAHRLAWLYMTGEWPSRDIDHRDTDRTNNRWANLRLATDSLNSANRSLSCRSTSGYKGAHWLKARGEWNSRIVVRGKAINLGYFQSAELAHEAYVKAAIEHFGEYSRAA